MCGGECYTAVRTCGAAANSNSSTETDAEKAFRHHARALPLLPGQVRTKKHPRRNSMGFRAIHDRNTKINCNCNQRGSSHSTCLKRGPNLDFTRGREDADKKSDGGGAGGHRKEENRSSRQGGFATAVQWSAIKLPPIARISRFLHTDDHKNVFLVNRLIPP